MSEDDCLLCRAEQVTARLFEDEECWVADCMVCATPMVVWRVHGHPDPDVQARLLEHLERLVVRSRSIVRQSQAKAREAEIEERGPHADLVSERAGRAHPAAGALVARGVRTRFATELVVAETDARHSREQLSADAWALLDRLLLRFIDAHQRVER